MEENKSEQLQGSTAAESAVSQTTGEDELMSVLAGEEIDRILAEQEARLQGDVPSVEAVPDPLVESVAEGEALLPDAVAEKSAGAEEAGGAPEVAGVGEAATDEQETPPALADAWEDAAGEGEEVRPGRTMSDLALEEQLALQQQENPDEAEGGEESFGDELVSDDELQSLLDAAAGKPKRPAAAPAAEAVDFEDVGDLDAALAEQAKQVGPDEAEPRRQTDPTVAAELEEIIAANLQMRLVKDDCDEEDAEGGAEESANDDAGEASASLGIRGLHSLLEAANRPFRFVPKPVRIMLGYAGAVLVLAAMNLLAIAWFF